MRNLLIGTAVAVSAANALAQDKITLTNDDVLTGTIKAMADGKVTIASPVLGDVTVPMSSIRDMTTQAQVELATKTGDRLQRRILGMEAGNLRLEGASTSLALDELDMINPPAKPEPKWTGSLKLNAMWAEGNTDRQAAGGTLDATMRREIDRIRFDAAWDYAQDKDGDPTSVTFRQWKLTQRRTGAGLQYDYFLSKRWYALVTTRVLGDTLADIDLRFTAGAGLGYTWIEDKTTTFLTEGGLSYVNENYRSDTPSEDYLAARFAYKLTHAFTDTTKLVHAVEAYPSTERLEDSYLQARTEVVTSLTESMLASLGHVIDYDNTPAPGRDRVDNRVVFSVGWSF
jgi:putative salt-induced outer membrane protein YdiY